MNKFYHFNFNVLNLDRSIKFYKEALGLTELRRSEHENFTLVFLKDDITSFSLELTYLKDRTTPYDLGDGEFHLAFQTDDYDNLLKMHQKMGCVCLLNEDMGVYFIEDPDGYWIEICPAR